MNNVIFKKARVFRNIANNKFSHKLSAEQKEKILEDLKLALGKDFKYIKLNEADQSVIKNLYTSGIINSKSTEVLLNLKTNVCIDLFNSEHISIISSSCYNNDVYKDVKAVADKLANKIVFAYSDEYGYLSSNLVNLGSGYQLEADICLDAICALNKIEQVKQNINNLGYSLAETNMKSIFKMSTKCSLGLSEDELSNEFNKTLEKLLELEMESAKMLDVSNHDEIYDKVMRSFAILNSAHLINYEELSTILIILRTGVNLGFINLTKTQLNELQMLCISANSNLVSKSECKELAEKIKEILKGE